LKRKRESKRKRINNNKKINKKIPRFRNKIKMMNKRKNHKIQLKTLKKEAMKMKFKKEIPLKVLNQ
jgi:S-adenosylmethionine synthetase